MGSVFVCLLKTRIKSKQNIHIKDIANLGDNLRN